MRESVETVLDALRDRGMPPLRIVIDGPSGSGKTTLATHLSERLGAAVLHLDDMYEGWGGLAAGTRIAEGLLSGVDTSYHPWDWESGTRAEAVTPDPSADWIIEGCGATTPVTAARADLVVWVDADLEEAKRRGLERDGKVFAKHWEMWRRQELEHWTKNEPRELSDLVVET